MVRSRTQDQSERDERGCRLVPFAERGEKQRADPVRVAAIAQVAPRSVVLRGMKSVPSMR